MRVLWIVNVPTPEASSLLNIDSTPYGGWLTLTSRVLSESDEIELSIAFPQSLDRQKYKLIKGEKIDYYPFKPQNKLNSYDEEELLKILEQSCPDIVHIFGTEYSHSSFFSNICIKNNIKFTVSIQGLVSVYSKHYMAHLPAKLMNKYTIKELIKRSNLKAQKSNFVKQGVIEKQVIMDSKYIIGRTDWDKACTEQINDSAKYFHCNENLRSSFYDGKWNINTKEKHSIFLSQGNYPIKGMHLMLEALFIVIKKYPNCKLYVAGNNIYKNRTIKEKLKLSTYAKYIISLIKKYNLDDKVVFTGPLNEDEMKKMYLKSHVFVCPSSIENSPNSLGEAMILGVPCITSNVGGVSNLIEHEKEGYIYQGDAPYMLAYYIEQVFKDDEKTISLSNAAIQKATSTHNYIKNNFRLIEIYKNILQKGTDEIC